MGKRLAIRGHSTRGNEVIEILEMMGGKKISNITGDNLGLCYLIDDENDIVRQSIAYEDDGLNIFTLEGFWAKYQFKVGDKAVYIDDNDIVVISEIEWDDTVGDIFYNVKRIDEDDCFLCPPELLKPYKETNMNKKLAIRGHSTRGKEVIKLLEMLGGKNSHKLDGEANAYSYYISGNTILHDRLSIAEDDDFEIFTLQGFLEKYPFKVGDFVRIPEYESEVRILKMKWTSFSDIDYLVYRNDDEEWYTANELLEYNDNPNKTRDCKNCGLHFGSIRCFDKDCPHNTPKPKSYAVGLKDGKVIDCIANKETDMNKREAINMTNETITPTPDITANVIDKNNCDIACPDGYEFYDMNGNLIGNTVKMRPKKPKYPTTYEECIALMQLQDTIVEGRCGYEWRLVSNLQKLLLCRDAYWKIAGEQMGLGKLWEPDWNDEIQKYCIRKDRNKIVNCSSSFNNRILAFPTMEMRDAFYENFKKEIEECKELL